jgi:hypothetical protein
MASERGCAVVVVAHLNKDKRGGDPLYRAGGSIGIPAAARSALLLARDPDDADGDRGSRRILAHVKCNVAPLAESQSADIVSIVLPGDEQVTTARISITGTSEVTGPELLRVVEDDERAERDEATDYLTVELGDGPQDSRRLIKEAPCSERTLRKAKARLGVESKRDGFGARGRWLWRLPAKDASPKTAPHISTSVQPMENPDGEGDSERSGAIGCKDAAPSARDAIAAASAREREPALYDELAPEWIEAVADRHRDGLA